MNPSNSFNFGSFNTNTASANSMTFRSLLPPLSSLGTATPFQETDLAFPLMNPQNGYGMFS